MAQYPGAIPTDADLHVAVNNQSTILSAGIDAVVATIPVASTIGFPSSGFITINSEIIKYTSVDATNFLGATRGADGSSATAHSINDVVAHLIVAAHHNDSKEEIKAIATELGINGATNIRSNLRNIVINGGMEIWQRGITFNTPANGAFTADKWSADFSGTISGHTVIFRQDNGPANIDNGTFSFNLDYQVKGNTISAAIIQDIENFKVYRGKTVSISVRIKSSIANSIDVTINDLIGSTVSSKHSGGGTFETLTVTRAMSTSAGRFQIEIRATEVGSYFIDSVMLVVSDQPMNFVPESPELALTRAKRYYEDGSTGTNNLTTLPMYRDASNNFADDRQYFEVEKSVIPTVTRTLVAVSMRQIASIGVGITGGDTANWTPVNNGIDTRKFITSFQRSPADATRDLAVIQYSWTAEA